MAIFSNSPLQPFGGVEGDEIVLYTLEAVECHVSREAEDEENAREFLGGGYLTVTSRRVLWDGGAEGFSLEMRLIGLHAVARDPTAVPAPCLYAQILLDSFPPGNHPSELFLVPRDPESLNDIFEAFSRSAALNPDVETADDDLFVGNSARANGDVDPPAMLQRYDDMLTVPPHLQHQFDDAPDPDDAPDSSS